MLEEDLQQLRAGVHLDTIDTKAQTLQQLHAAIKSKAQESLDRRGYNGYKAADMSVSAVNSYIRALKVKRVKKLTVQNQRRLEVSQWLPPRLTPQVINDPLTGISAAAVFQAVMGTLEDDDQPVAETMFNVDVTSFDLRGDSIDVHVVTEEGVEELADMQLSATATEPKTQRRCCSLMTLVSAGGSLDAAIVFFKDTSLDKCISRKVPKYCWRMRSRDAAVGWAVLVRLSRRSGQSAADERAVEACTVAHDARPTRKVHDGRGPAHIDRRR